MHDSSTMSWRAVSRTSFLDPVTRTTVQRQPRYRLFSRPKFRLIGGTSSMTERSTAISNFKMDKLSCPVVAWTSPSSIILRKVHQRKRHTNGKPKTNNEGWWPRKAPGGTASVDMSYPIRALMVYQHSQLLGERGCAIVASGCYLKCEYEARSDDATGNERLLKP
jgi:hypothetical protein